MFPSFLAPAQHTLTSLGNRRHTAEPLVSYGQAGLEKIYNEMAKITLKKFTEFKIKGWPRVPI